MTALRILVTSAYYWPEVAGNAPYVTALAEGLARRGHDVRVVTGFPHYPEWRRRGRVRLAQTKVHGGVEVRRRWHYVPQHHSAAHRAVYELSLLAGGITALPLRWRPDAVLGVSPSFSGAVLAMAAAKLYRRPFGVVFQDLAGPAAAQSGFSGGGRVAGVLRRAELAVARQAAGVGIITAGFRGYLEGGGVEPSRIHRVRNWFIGEPPATPPAETREALGWAPGDFVCLHAGNMGHKQGLSNVIRAAALVDDPGIRIVLAGDGNERLRLEAEARETGGAVQFLGPQRPGAYEAMLAAADLLLVNQLPAVNDMALPSKLTSYFSAGRPVLAAAAPGSETATEVELSGGGIVVAPGDPAALADAIRGLRYDADEVARLGRQGRAYATQCLEEGAALDDYEVLLRAVAGGGR